MQEFWFSNFEKSHWLILALIIFFTLTGAGKGRELTFSLSIDRPNQYAGLVGKWQALSNSENWQQATIISIIKEKRKRKLSLEPNQHLEILCLPIISNLALWVPLVQFLQTFLGIFNNFDNILLWKSNPGWKLLSFNQILKPFKSSCHSVLLQAALPSSF